MIMMPPFWTFYQRKSSFKLETFSCVEKEWPLHFSKCILLYSTEARKFYEFGKTLHFWVHCPFKGGRWWRKGNSRSDRQGCWHNWSPNFTRASAEEMRTPQVYCPPILLPIPEEREGERDRWKKENRTKPAKQKKQKSHVWARWQAGSRRKCWIGRAVRCVWEWEGWRLPTQRPAAQQHSNPAETGQGETLRSPDAQGQGWAERRGDQMRLGGGRLRLAAEMRMVSWDRH